MGQAVLQERDGDTIWARGAATQPAPALARGTIVLLASDLAGIHTPDGGLLPPEHLGPGLVEACGPGDALQVHWLDADLTLPVPAADVCPLAADRHLVTVQRCDRRGHCTRLGRGVVALSHHWTVELRPGDVIRAVRADGPCWTFGFNPLSHEVEPPWGQQLTDDAAEAVVAADLALAQTVPTRRLFGRWSLARAR